jgi:hypothetical protein
MGNQVSLWLFLHRANPMSLQFSKEMVRVRTVITELMAGGIILYQGKESTEVGAVARIRTAEQTSLNEIRQSLTLAFTQDGMKLILIDDQVQVPQQCFLQIGGGSDFQ